MAGKTQQSGTLAPAPPGFEESAESFDRLTQLAEALFAPSKAQITILSDGKPWRSHDPAGALGPKAKLTEMAIARKKVVWIADTLRDRHFRTSPYVTDGPRLRHLAAAPVRLPDGSAPGALCVGGRQPRIFEPGLAARLQDLADLVADEWSRVQSKRAEAASTRESLATRQVLGTIIGNAPTSLLMLDRDLRILAASRRWLASRELRARDAIGRRLVEVMPQARSWTRSLERCLSGETIESDRGRVDAPDGSPTWWRTQLSPWRRASGEVGGVLISSHEITDMIEALERGARSEERLRLALEIADVHVWEVDNERRELIKVGAEDTVFDKPTTYRELAGDIWSTVDPRDRPAAKAEWRSHMATGAPFRPEYRVVRADGREVWVSSAVRVIRNDDNQVIRIVGAMQNITERKLAENALVQAKDEAEAATRAKSAFLATMSHEIRTPLNGVLGMAQAMSRDELSEPQRKRLDVIRQSGEALLAILNDVLDLSKIEAGKLELEQAAFDMSELTRSAHATFAATAQAKGLAFELKVAPAAKGVYQGDPVRLRQILYNLISNALKFTDRGSVRVKVDRSRGRTTFTVADTGVGIPAEKLSALFRKFEQADASTTRRYGGTGLGLAICRELAELMGGSIAAASRQGHGATFTVEVPLKKTARRRPEAAIRDKPARPAAVPATVLRVLAAEDNGVNQLVLKTLLAQIGVEPVFVADGRAAVGAWEQQPWDVILMDVQMPDMDGPTATSIIRAREAADGRPRTPIVALTANAMAHQVQEYRAAGMDAFVAKPIEAACLFEAVLAAAASRRPAPRRRSAAA
jgi:PAS domain S-box-containing protein